ncbi:tetratricopeptide repeat protein [Streptomyces sp. NPDC056529]|uniref:SEL1-like repeat protein n=1 Tax=Streptomyces sp. NPDC056529 TaxID=3345855 RepID=UPI0036B83FB3
MVVLVGSSSTGKTRACWEAIQPLAVKGWRLWHPYDPTRAEAALDALHRVRPQTVVWLNEAQHYLGNRAVGEQIAAAVHQLLVTSERGPVLVLGTLWPEYATRYAALPAPGREDPHSRARELLAGRVLTVPETFDAPAMAAAAALAGGGDQLLADALSRSGANGRITQDLAGAPELLNRYQHATPAATAVLQAAMDARRLGVGLYLPHVFLTDAASDYLTDTDYDQLTDDWAEHAFAELAIPVHGKQAPLGRTTPRARRRPPAVAAILHGPSSSITGPVFRLADYLEQHGRTSRSHLCPPASFWHAAYTHLTDPNDLGNLTQAAENRHRLQWAHFLRRRAADYGNTDALYHLAVMREAAGDRAEAERLARQAADHGSISALHYLAVMREEAGDRAEAEHLARQAADHGDTHVLYRLAEMREEAGDRAEAEHLARQAADHDNTRALYRLAEMRDRVGDWDGAEALLRQAADHGSPTALYRLARMQEETGNQDEAEALLRQAADHGSPTALYRLARMQEEAGNQDEAEALAQQAADQDNTDALYYLAEMRGEAGDGDGAEALARQAADHGDTRALFLLAEMREGAGDRDGAEVLVRQAAELGNPNALYLLAEMREGVGDRDGAEALLRQASDHGDTGALYRLAEMREGAGDRDGAEALLQQAADHGDTGALYRLAEIRDRIGDRDGSETLLRQAADRGTLNAPYHLERSEMITALWPHGLDPDGTPTSLWTSVD